MAIGLLRSFPPSRTKALLASSRLPSLVPLVRCFILDYYISVLYLYLF